VTPAVTGLGEPSGWVLFFSSNLGFLDERQLDATGKAVLTTTVPADSQSLIAIYAGNYAFGSSRSESVGSISGDVFNDLNADGYQQTAVPGQTAEPGLQGWTVLLEDASGNVLQQTTTDANGNYSFKALQPGTYRVREVLQAGWRQTSANPADIQIVGQDVQNVNFGDVECPVMPFVPDYAGSIVPGHVGAGDGAAFGADGQDPGNAAISDNSIRFFDGEVIYQTTDLSSASQGNGWGQTRSYVNQFGYAADWVNGTGWLVSQMPFLDAVVGDNQQINQIVAVSGDNNMRWFNRQANTDNWQGMFFLPETLTHDPTQDTYMLADSLGNRTVYFGFGDTVPYTERGKVMAFFDPAGHETTYNYGVVGEKPDPTNQQQMIPVYEVTDIIRQGATTTEAWHYTYTQGANYQQLISSVGMYRNGTLVRSVSYSYYQDGDPNGGANDLRMMTLRDPDGTVVDEELYRYYPGTANHRSLLKSIVSGANYERFKFDTNLDLADPDVNALVSDAQLKPYADQWFVYGNMCRVIEHDVQGAGVSRANLDATGIFIYNYASNTNFPGPGYISWWAYKVTETRPDQTTVTAYCNQFGEVMLQVVQPAGSTLQWLTAYVYDGFGRVSYRASPSALFGYSEDYNDLLGLSFGGTYLRSDQGLITGFTYRAGYLSQVYLRHGSQGTPVLQSVYAYGAQTGADGVTISPETSSTVFRNDDGSLPIITRFAYANWMNLQPMQITTTLPEVSATQNGPNIATTQVETLDEWGREVSSTDAAGIINTTEYDDASGTVTKTVVDAGGLNLTTQVLGLDFLGRPTATSDPNGNVTMTSYTDGSAESSVTTTPAAPDAPIQIVRVDRARGYTETMTRSRTDNSIQSLSRTYVDHGGRTVRVIQYFNLAGTTYSKDTVFGTLTQNNVTLVNSGNYYESDQAYDVAGRPNMSTDAVGTITVTGFDGLGRPTTIEVGTSLQNLTLVQTNYYDNGRIGDGNLTETDQYPGGGAATRVTQNYFDWRDRRVASESGIGADQATTHPQIVFCVLDNLGECTEQLQYDGSNQTPIAIREAGGTASDVPAIPDLDQLRAESTTQYDDQGRVYRQLVYSVAPNYDPSDGGITGFTLGGAIETDKWYDLRGNVVEIATSGQPVQKMAYDGANRVSAQYTTDGSSGTSWDAAQMPRGDIVLQQVQNSYDKNGNVIFVTSMQRFHNAPTDATGPLSGSLARVSYVANWYDKINRLTQTVNFGTNGGTAPAPAPSNDPTDPRPVLPGRSSVYAFSPSLRSDQTYDAGGWLQDTVDPQGLVTHRDNDALGRVSVLTEDYLPGVQPSSDVNRKTTTIYDGLNHTRFVQASNVGQQPALQITAYAYGVTTQDTMTGPNPPTIIKSRINSNDLLRAIDYPSPSNGQASALSANQESYLYNALGEMIARQQRTGVVHAYTIDSLGRQTADDVLIPAGSKVDASVTGLHVRYDSFGRPDLFTSIGSAQGQNAVLRQYNGFGQVSAEYQEHNGTTIVFTGPDASAKVGYIYADAAHGSRLTGIQYPGGSSVTYTYNPGLDDRISRVSSISDPSGVVETYQYLGLSTIVQETYPQPEITLSYVKQEGVGGTINDGGDQYVGLDRFGQVIDQTWVQATPASVFPITIDREQYGYSADLNRVYTYNAKDPSASETDQYDRLNRLTTFQRGSMRQPTESPQFIPVQLQRVSNTQTWNLDQQGNWLKFTSANRDDPSQNITFGSAYNGQNFYNAPGFKDNANGDLTQYTQVSTPRGMSYDAWDRLVSVDVANVAT
jgi:YD repeat-containing protein